MTEYNKLVRVGIYIICVFILMTSCKKDVGQEQELVIEFGIHDTPQIPENYYDYENAYIVPEHFNTDPLLTLIYANIEPENNPITNAGAALGRVLFYDQKLSINNEIACASCHIQEHAFSDPRQNSIGVFGQMSDRNSMGFQNLKYSRRMFRDLRINGLENQIEVPIQNIAEMGISMEDLVTKLSGVAYYSPLVQDAFGSQEWTAERISFALSQFIRSITTFNSKYDQGIQNGFNNFSEMELAGKELFFGGDFRCNHCHTTQNFFSPQAMNNGLDTMYVDQGQFLATGEVSDIGLFKVPSLRNIALTAPYMHDGRFSDVEEVLEHYSIGVQPHPNLNDRITVEITTGGSPFLINMTDQEKIQLIAFLNTLTDLEMISDEKFANPFYY